MEIKQSTSQITHSGRKLILGILAIFVALLLAWGPIDRSLRWSSSYDRSAWMNGGQATRARICADQQFLKSLPGMSESNILHMLGPPDYKGDEDEYLCFYYRLRWHLSPFVHSLVIRLRNGVVTDAATRE